MDSEENKRNINRILNSVTYYFEFISEKTPSICNPARNIRIKSSDKRLVHDLLDYNELIEIYTETKIKDTKTGQKPGNSRIYNISRTNNYGTSKFKIEDLRFEEGNVLIQEGYQDSLKKGTARRILPLEAIQMVDLVEYLHQIRPKILAESI